MSTVQGQTQSDWLSQFDRQSCGLVDLRALAETSSLILAVTKGELFVTVRNIRADGQLGSAARLAVAVTGQVLLVPRPTSEIQFTLSGSLDSEAIVIDEAELANMNPQQDTDRVIVGHFLNPREALGWLSEQKNAVSDENDSYDWPKVIRALGLEVERRAKAILLMEREAFRTTIARSVQLDEAMLDDALSYATKSAGMADATVVVEGVNSTDAACRRVMQELGVEVPDHIEYESSARISLLEQFTRSVRLRRRAVALNGDWWTQDGGHLLAFRSSDGCPVALIRGRKSYEAYLFDEQDFPKVIEVDAEFSSSLQPTAEMFYRRMPSRSLNLRDVLSFVAFGNGKDLLYILCAVLGSAGLVALIPIMTGTIVDWIIPQVAVNTLVFVGVVLLGAVLGKALLDVVAGLAFVRLETRSSFNLLAAFVDRILSLPVSFFRNRSAGDLAQRVMAIEQVRSMLTQSVLSVLMASVSALANLSVLFLYDLELAIYGILLAGLQIVFVVAMSIFYSRRTYDLSVAKGRLEGLALDVLAGMRQVRVQGSMSRVLSRIIQSLAPVGQASYRIGVAMAVNYIVLVVIQGIALAIVFETIASRLQDGQEMMISSGGFVAYITALQAFFNSIVMLGPALSSIVAVIPMHQRLKPILEAVPEVTNSNNQMQRLQGDIEVRDLVVGYDENLPPVLIGISMRIHRGEFVAVVGRTGCGKSTLLRTLLGLELPQSGAVFFDGSPLENLDASVVRSQTGVVMQSNQILPGSIMTTILGLGSKQSEEDAWEAARLVGMSEEIEAMPLGMETVVEPDTLSMSQAQRLLIARALVRHPEILLLDEATSALNNQAQDQISQSIGSLANTRIVIAHRLSTIRAADQIYVLKDGDIIQSGNFEELSSEGGHFLELMDGQLS